MTGLAVARGCLVGLDAEKSSRLTSADPLKLARRRFSDREVAVLKGVDETPTALLLAREQR